MIAHSEQTMNSVTQTTAKLALATVLTLGAGTALAASDGTLGATSTGQSDITLVKGHGIRISDVDDVNFGTTTTNPADQYEDICIYSTSGDYTVTATSANGLGNQFRLLGQTGFEYIVYDIEWTSNTSATAGDNLNNGVVSNIFNGANSVLEDCNGIPTARLIVDIMNGSFNAASQDTYADVLTITVEPN